MHNNLCYNLSGSKASIVDLTLRVGVGLGGAFKDNSFAFQFNRLGFILGRKMGTGLAQSHYIPQYSGGCSFVSVVGTWFDHWSNQFYGLRPISYHRFLCVLESEGPESNLSIGKPLKIGYTWNTHYLLCAPYESSFYKRSYDIDTWPARRQAIIWTNTGIFLIGSLGKNFNGIIIKGAYIFFEKNPF